jgi:hypothetical protein
MIYELYRANDSVLYVSTDCTTTTRYGFNFSSVMLLRAFNFVNQFQCRDPFIQLLFLLYVELCLNVDNLYGHLG